MANGKRFVGVAEFSRIHRKIQFNINDDTELREIAILPFFRILCESMMCDVVAAWESFSLPLLVASMLASHVLIYLSPFPFHSDAMFQLMR